MSSIVVSGDVSGSVTLQAPSAAGTTVLTLPTTSGTLVTTGGGSTGSFTTLTSTGASSFATSSGSVGIGTSSPTQPLELVKSTNAATWISAVNTNSGSGAAAGFLMTSDTGVLGALQLNSSTNTTSGAINAVVLRTLSTNPLVFATNATERMRIDSSGNVGMGTTTPTSPLTIDTGALGTAQDILKFVSGYSSPSGNKGILWSDGSGNNIGRLAVSYSGGVASMTFGSLYNGGSNNTELMRLAGNGDFLVGCTAKPASNRQKGFGANNNSSGGIQVYQTTSNSDWAVNANTGSICNFYSDNGSTVVYAGSITVTGNTAAYTSVSDYRLKENIKPMVGALATVDKLKPVTFNFKEGNQKSQGFIAHELQAVVPDAVTGEKDAVKEDGTPDYQGVDTSFLIATLTAAIQELNAKVTALEAQLAGAK